MNFGPYMNQYAFPFHIENNQISYNTKCRCDIGVGKDAN